MRSHVVATLVLVFGLWLLGYATLPRVTEAQQPSPSMGSAASPMTSAPTTPTTPVASGVPASSAGPSVLPSMPATADCAWTTGLLPGTLDGARIGLTVAPGITAIDPDDLLDPLLASLGRTRQDVCVVEFRYGDDGGATGQLLRITGAGSADLAERFTSALGERLVAYGAEASAAPVEIDGHQVSRLAVTADGRHTDLLVLRLGDSLLIMSDEAAMARLLPMLGGD